MSREKGRFLFKRFGVSHHRSSMKVGVDGVLVGLWATAVAGRTLDCGTGCGVISLILAQRLSDYEVRIGNEGPGFSVLGIDTDSGSVEEARENFLNSPWSARLEAAEMSFEDLLHKGVCYDHIVSNPPFFDSGVSKPESRRMVARHGASLSPLVLALNAGKILNPCGRLTMIFPYDQYESVKRAGEGHGLRLDRATFVRDHPSAPVKRVVVEFVKESLVSVVDKCNEVVPGELVLFQEDGIPTPEYQKLGRDFYLKF